MPADTDFLADVITRITRVVETTAADTQERRAALVAAETELRRVYGNDRVRIKLPRDVWREKVTADYIAVGADRAGAANGISARRVLQIAKGK